MPQGIKPTQTTNILSDIFETLRFKGTIFFSSDLCAPWGIKVDPKNVPRFHIALRGGFYFGTENAQPQQISEMDVFLLPNGDPHWLADSPQSPRQPSQQVVEACELSVPMFQNGEVTHKLMCGLVQFENGLHHPIIDSLPPVVHFSNLSRDSTAWQLISLIDSEISNHGYQRNAVVDKLAEALFLTLISQFLNENQEKYGFIRGVNNRQVYQALQLIHHDPGKEWTLEALGKQVGMSKATLVRHFHEALGMAPISYLNQWRRLKAYNALRYSDAPIEDIAMSLGFVSGRTLSRALVRDYGMSPAEIRGLTRVEMPHP